MSPTETPLRRSIGLAGAIRWVIAIAAVIAIGAAAGSGRYVVAGVLAAFVIIAGILGSRTRRA